MAEHSAFAVCPLSLLFSFAHWPPVIPALLVLRICWAASCMKAFQPEVPCDGDVLFPTLGAQLTLTSQLKFPFSQQTFSSTYHAPHALLGAWSYISEQNRQKALSLWTNLLSLP